MNWELTWDEEDNKYVEEAIAKAYGHGNFEDMDNGPIITDIK